MVPSVSLETLTAEIRVLQNMVEQSIIHIGLRLIAARELVPHGQWLKYLDERLEYTPRWAQMCMKAAKTFGSNANDVSHLPTGKVVLLLEAPEEERDELIAQAADLPLPDLEARVRELNEAKRRTEEAERRATELEQRAAAAQREAIETGRRLDKITQEKGSLEEQLRNRPIIEVEKVVQKTITAPDPRQGVIIDQLKAELQEERRKHAELLAAANGTEEQKRALAAATARVEQKERRLQRLAIQFDDEGRDQHGGSKIMDAMEPLFTPLADAVAKAMVVRRLGAGGFCDDDKLFATVPQLRQLADILEEILKDRASRPINVTPKEVE